MIVSSAKASRDRMNYLDQNLHCSYQHLSILQKFCWCMFEFYIVHILRYHKEKALNAIQNFI